MLPSRLNNIVSIFLALFMAVLLLGCDAADIEKNDSKGVSDDFEDDAPPPLPSEDSNPDEKISETEDAPPPPPDDSVQTQQELSNDDEELPALPADDEATGNTESANAASLNNPSEFVGLWRAFSSRLFYDVGGGGAVGSGTGKPLEINADGTWQFSTSAGTWAVDDIQPEDWTKWGINAYGPTRKVTLSNWDKGTADGPVEEADGNVDFFWVIYRVGPPTVGSPGQVQAKYGHAS